MEKIKLAKFIAFQAVKRRSVNAKGFSFGSSYVLVNRLQSRFETKYPVAGVGKPKDPVGQNNPPKRPRQKELVLEIEGQAEKVKAKLYESKWGYSTYVPEGFLSSSENWNDKFIFDLNQKYYML